MAGVNLHPWSWKNPAIRMFLQSTDGIVREMVLKDEVWHEGTLKLRAPISARIAVAHSVAKTDGRGKIIQQPRMRFFWSDGPNVYSIDKDRDKEWEDEDDKALVMDDFQTGGQIAVVTTPTGGLKSEIHFFATSENCQFYHIIMKGDSWDVKEIDPYAPVQNLNIAPQQHLSDLGHPGAEDELELEPSLDHIDNTTIDPGVFGNSMRSAGLSINDLDFKLVDGHGKFQTGDGDSDGGSIAGDGGGIERPEEATYEETSERLKTYYAQLIQHYEAVHSSSLSATTLPINFKLSTQKANYKWTDGFDNYPPHQKTGIFKDAQEALQAGGIFSLNIIPQIALLFTAILPVDIKKPDINPARFGQQPWNYFTPNNLQGLPDNEVALHKVRGPNLHMNDSIGHRKDWYTDKQFAQQHFTGPNPTTIRLASANWITSFEAAATAQKNNTFTSFLKGLKKESVYVQDYSYFRLAMKLSPNEDIQCVNPDDFGKEGWDYFSTSATPIVLDYREDDIVREGAYYVKKRGDAMPRSVSVFNKRLKSTDSTKTEEKDFHWRYAKIELDNFINSAYDTFHWEDLYIPTDLKKRGFPVEYLKDKKFSNYPYAKNVLAMWNSIHALVKAMVIDWYGGDTNRKIAKDNDIKKWIKEMRIDGKMQYFPEIHNLEQLTNVLTMCIHIASPQHTAVNYLQEYYQVFVPNKPSSFFQPIPKRSGPDDFSALGVVDEQFIISSLPFERPGEDATSFLGIGNVWLLAAHLPHLLSVPVGEKESLRRYAEDLYKDERARGSEQTKKAAGKFLTDMRNFEVEFEKTSKNMTNRIQPSGYSVLRPTKTAVSILI
ncbi:hypothetical protein H072_1547 [Dactylellina haptotyla CBS 200.50]|uniref:Manganese lipoxygenase n=1 Tax=Dactylellina haptotyla (strain CBS 200.50) TaxID=1284197 RepID=S8BY98_DACHA|nr:hypothetical protein H072_1547 [Dactylellina haptotyla CBS 200.50]